MLRRPLSRHTGCVELVHIRGMEVSVESRFGADRTEEHRYHCQPIFLTFLYFPLLTNSVVVVALRMRADCSFEGEGHR